MTRLRAGVTACPTDGGMVLLDEHSGRYWQLNRTGALVVQELLDGATPIRWPTDSRRAARCRRSARPPTSRRSSNSSPGRSW